MLRRSARPLLRASATGIAVALVLVACGSRTGLLLEESVPIDATADTTVPPAAQAPAQPQAEPAKPAPASEGQKRAGDGSP
jgi:hypothetical protein